MSKHYYEHYWSTEGTGATSNSELTQELRQILAANISPSAHCLDVGCGSGGVCGLWAQANAASYVGVDISAAAVAEARTLGLDARVINDPAALPFPDCSFDVVICTEVLEHLFEPHTVVSEIARVLQPGGILIATVPNVAYWRRRLEFVTGRWNPLGDQFAVEQPWRDPHIRFFNIGSLKRMLVGSGYRQVQLGGHLGTFLGRIPWMLLDKLPGGHRLTTRKRASAFYRLLEQVQPSLFAYRLHAIATKPKRR